MKKKFILWSSFLLIITLSVISYCIYQNNVYQESFNVVEEYKIDVKFYGQQKEYLVISGLNQDKLLA